MFYCRLTCAVDSLDAHRLKCVFAFASLLLSKHFPFDPLSRSRILRQRSLPLVPLDLRDMHGPHGERLLNMLQQFAAPEQ